MKLDRRTKSLKLVDDCEHVVLHTYVWNTPTCSC